MHTVVKVANGVAIGILLVGAVFYAAFMWFYITHPASPMSAQLNSMREDIKTWMERALMFLLGSSMGSKTKDVTPAA